MSSSFSNWRNIVISSSLSNSDPPIGEVGEEPCTLDPESTWGLLALAAVAGEEELPGMLAEPTRFTTGLGLATADPSTPRGGLSEERGLDGSPRASG